MMCVHAVSHESIGLREGVLSTYHKAWDSRQTFAIRFHSHYSHLVLEEETIALPRGAIL